MPLKLEKNNHNKNRTRFALPSILPILCFYRAPVCLINPNAPRLGLIYYAWKIGALKGQ